MPEIETSKADFKPFDFLDSLYEQTIGQGMALGFNLFDVQLCRHIDLAWLCQQEDQCGASVAEIERLVKLGIIRTWMDRDGNRGFLLYTPQQIKTFKELQALGRYGEEELRYIMARWDLDLECTLEILPYDDSDGSDFESFRRRISEHIEETKQQIQWRREYSSSPKSSDEYEEHLVEELRKYERIFQKLEYWATLTLTQKMKDWIDRSLFRLRLIDEWVRVSNAEKYRAQIVQGFGPDVFFSSYSNTGIEFTFDRIDWKTTLRQLQHRASQGKSFPLRTPDFDLTHAGLTFSRQPTPDAYAKLYERYRFAELGEAIEAVGSGLWAASSQPSDSAVCAGCGAFFRRTLAAKQYCSEKCRSRAKQRRYRERDPERARLAQARYWRNYDDDFTLEP